MNALLDGFLVATLLLVSVGYAAYKLGPRAFRKRTLEACSRVMASAPSFLSLGRVARSLASASQAKAQGACGGCDNCGTETSQAPPPSAEIKIPVEKIGRRAPSL
jgi:hypothetical protein